MSGILEATFELIGEIINHFLLLIIIGAFVVVVNAVYIATALPAGSPFAASKSTAMNMFSVFTGLIDLVSVVAIIIAFIIVVMKIKDSL